MSLGEAKKSATAGNTCTTAAAYGAARAVRATLAPTAIRLLLL